MKKSAIIVLICIFPAVVSPKTSYQPQPRPFTARANDGLALKGTLYRPVGLIDAGPTVILLPMMANDRRSWGDFPKKLQAAGYIVLAMDQRGHGESVWKGKKKVSYSQFTNNEFAKMVTDLDAVLKTLYIDRDADPHRVAIVGASIGANAALVYATGHPAVKAVALLSPGLDYHGITTEDAAASYGNRPALIVVSKGDGYAALSSQKLAEKIGASATLKIYGGSEHGTRIFAEQKDFGQFLFDWTTAHFPATDSSKK